MKTNQKGHKKQKLNNKYKISDEVRLLHKGVTITVREIVVDGKRQERFFIDHKGFNDWGGRGWWDVNQMVKEYQLWKKETCRYKSREERWRESDEGQYLRKHCLAEYYRHLEDIRKSKKSLIQ